MFGASYKSLKRRCDIQKDIKIHMEAGATVQPGLLKPSMSQTRKSKHVVSIGKAKKHEVWHEDCRRA